MGAVDTQHIDQAISDLQASKSTWATLDIQDKLTMLRELRTKAGEHARRWVEIAVKAKGLSMDSPIAGEEWLGGPFGLVDAINGIETTLVRVAEGSDVLKGIKISERPDGQVVLRVIPFAASDRVLLSGSTADVWMNPDVTIDTLQDNVATFYRSDSPKGVVRLVLGAGNVGSIPPLDLLNTLFTEGEVALLKMNPVNDYLGEVFEAIFANFIRAGFLRIVYGAGDVGAYLTTHDGIDVIHITGSATTYNAIRYGTGEQGEANRKADTPINTKKISAELGGISPTIVVPGDWSRRDLTFQAENIVTSKMNNSGFNCIATQVLVLPESWDQSEALLDEIRKVLANLGDRDAYYPGADDRCDAVAAGSGNVETFGTGARRMLVTGLDATRTDDDAFTSEYFAPALSVVTLPSPDIAAYLQNATAFANDVLMGTLGASIIIHPKTEKVYADAVDGMIANLRYGGIGVNTWSASIFLYSRCPWGAFPGHTPQDIGSGVGVVHNTLMLTNTQKAVARSPFAPSHRTLGKGEIHIAPKPLFFVTNKQLNNTAEHLVDFVLTGKTTDMLKVVASAIRG